MAGAQTVSEVMNDHYRLSTSRFGGHATVARHVNEGKGTVLDVGCNKGYLATLYSRSLTVFGVEGNAQAAEIARGQLTTVVVHDLNNLTVDPFPLRRFDQIVFADVLEHLIDPLAILTWYVNHKLETGGRVVISLPNIANWQIRLRLLCGQFEYEDSGILDRTHLHFYTYESAKRLVADALLQLDEVDAGASVFGPIIRWAPFLRGILATNVVLVAHSR